MAVRSEQRADLTPYGDVQYADPGYQADKQKRYPIDTEEHVRAAWSYINHAHNAAQYSSSQLDEIKGRIRAAAKKFGIQISDDDSSSGRSASDEVERRWTQVPVEVRSVDGRKRIGGYAAVFNRESRPLGGSGRSPGGFTERVAQGFFEQSRGDGWPGVLCRYNHMDEYLLGTTAGNTLHLTIDRTGLDYLCDPPATRADVVELVERRDVSQSSFAFRVPRGGDEWDLNEQGFARRTLVTGLLKDVAPCVTGAYPDATAGLRSLAHRFDASYDEVRSMAEANELRRFFVRTDGGPPRPRKTLAAAALVDLLGREDPWADQGQ